MCYNLAMKSWKDLSISLAGLTPESGAWPGPRDAIEWVSTSGIRAIQLDAAMPGLRPRELDSSARKGVVSLLKRLELAFTGVDLWIPPEHFVRPDTQQRAVDAVDAALAFANDLKGLEVPPTVSLRFPEEGGGWKVHLETAAAKIGVMIADHAAGAPATNAASAIGAGVDPAAELERGRDPASVVARLGIGLVSARLSDYGSMKRTTVGRGSLDLMAYGAALATIQFARPLVLDVRGVEKGQESVAEATAAWPPL